VSGPGAVPPPSRVHGFPPIATPAARILVLGTMPGTASLAAGQYYAHPRNAFWRIAGEVLGFDPGLPYEARTAALGAGGIAVWDVLQLCTRESSLDSDIDPRSLIPNDFDTFFAAHRDVRRVCFNGAKAMALYVKHVQPGLDGWAAEVEHVRLPSTSPANAGVPYAEKLRTWTAALGRGR
jgi:double-stranded uracil-DNA glycosylase